MKKIEIEKDLNFKSLYLKTSKMANLIDITSDILSLNTICFETRNINTQHITIPLEDAKFGILNFKAITAEETSDELDFLIVVDCSGSMSDMCSDGRSKMQHIIHTLKNMIIFFHEHPSIKVNITVNAFDTEIYYIVARTKITDENYNKIIYKIERILPRGRTNIEFALIKSSEEINRLKSEFPSNIITHIFMTDGETTDGSQDIDVLQTNVISDITNAFIGFGVEHDAALLNGISSIGKSAYYFIDKLESAGLVYGEILHGIVYKLITDCEINIENGLIYNFKTNTWVNSLIIGDIVSEVNKIYNIVASKPNECRVNIKGRVRDNIVLLPANLIETEDLTVQIYRQRTLQLLYEANDFCNRKRARDNNSDFSRYGLRYLEDEKKVLKLKLVSFLEEIKKYMTDNHLEENKVLKNLCDDIYICYRTFGTKFGTMFCTARQTSQGTQRQYTASSIEATEDQYGVNRIMTGRGYVPNIPVLTRRTNADELDDLLDEVHDIQHIITDFENTPYMTPQATQIMREISRPIDDDEFSISTQEIN